MKKTILFSSVLALTFLLFFSCEKKQIESYEPAVLTGADVLNYSTTPNVIFSYLEVNESSQETSGWLIDKKGMIHTVNSIDNPLDLSNQEILKSKLNSFLSNATETGSTVDVEELGTYFKKVRTLIGRDLSIISEDDDALISTHFIGFDLYMEEGTCENCPGSAVSDFQVSQILMKSSGVLNGSIEHNYTREIMGWMQELNSGL